MSPKPLPVPDSLLSCCQTLYLLEFPLTGVRETKSWHSRVTGHPWSHPGLAVFRKLYILCCLHPVQETCKTTNVCS